MTRTEQAYVKRLEKCINNLLTGYHVIKTWLSFPNQDDTIYHIGSLVTQEIEAEKYAQAKEEKSNE